MLHPIDADHADCKLLQVGKEDCFAVFDAVGVIHDPAVQSCLFERP